MTFPLSKLHGLGNDFLVHLTDDESALADLEAWSRRARDWCERHQGVGADGLILGVRGVAGSDLVMVLHNADGSRAEMSGNGIRCLVHADARRQGRKDGRWSIATDGGQRTVQMGPDPAGDPRTMTSAVDMGAGRPGPVATKTPSFLDSVAVDVADSGGTDEERFALHPKELATFDLGNPHLVLLVDDPGVVDMAVVGAGWEACFADGINVHAVAPTPHETDAVTMAIWERGVGPTAACGTGATAVALAAHQWGLVADRVTVHMPGGDVVVDVGDTLTLEGPSVFVAHVEVPR